MVPSHFIGAALFYTPASQERRMESRPLRVERTPEFERSNKLLRVQKDLYLSQTLYCQMHEMDCYL